MPDKIDKSQMASEYGFALAFMNSDPELKKLFNQAVKGTWDTSRFIAKLRDTKWFKHHSAAVRNAIMQQTSDPATYKSNLDQMYATVRDSWGKLFGESNLNDKQLRRWAETAHRMGWSEAQLVDHMTKGVNYQKLLQKKDLGGTAAEMSQQLDQLAGDYGLNLGNTWKAKALERIIEGGDTIGGVQNQLRELAKREYAAWADQIDGGQTIAEIADPYKQKMASLLELNPNDVSIHDAMIQTALKQKTDKGKPAALSLADFSDMVRKDKRWAYTDNAREQVASLTQNLLNSFGLVS